MPLFRCQVCEAEFEIAQASLDRYPGWRPRYCRLHSPKKRASAAGRSSARKRGPVSSPASSREERLTLDEVLAKYPGDPVTGVFTDGSAIPNPGPGGWGVVWVEGGEVVSRAHGHDPDTTNNRMELRALIEAFKMLPADAAIDVHSDSELCVNTITKWAPAWERRGWKRKTGPIRNLDLVRELLERYRAHHDCRLRWIAAHAGHRWNEYADSLATAWMRETL